MAADIALSVVIATLADTRRRANLIRAIKSIRDQSEAVAIVIVVNGGRSDNALVSEVSALPNVTVVHLKIANLVAALTAGVEHISGGYYCFLDDDDVLLPGSINRRIDLCQRNPDAEVIVTPGLKRFNAEKTDRAPTYFDPRNVLKSLFEDIWLCSCSAVYRRDVVGPEYFESLPQYLEWTHLALQLLRTRQFKFCFDNEDPHYMVFVTEGSTSASESYILNLPDNIESMISADMPQDIVKLLSKKCGGALHSASSFYKRNGKIKAAWRYHIRSLTKRGGLAYLSYTRHLVRASIDQYLR